MHRHGLPIGLAGLLAGLLVASSMALGASAQAGDQPDGDRAASTLDWSSCFQREARQIREITGDASVRFQCAILRVPLDYDRPNGPKIDIAVNRLPARGGTAELGSLIVNPGGPGGSGVDFTVFGAPFIYADEIRDQFDVVSFDPRGVGRSEVLRCFDRPNGIADTFTDFPYPVTKKEIRQWRRGDQALARACREADPRIIDHLSTANVARDMDMLRQAVGDDQLTYQGFSYGTYLGATYANLFPDRIRAMVVDGVLDPVAWSGLGGIGRRQVLDERLGSGTSANATLDEFFRLCAAAGPSRCALAPNPRQRWNALLAEGKRNPIVGTVATPDGTLDIFETDRSLIGGALGALYNSAGWGGFAGYLALVEEAAGLSPRSEATASRRAPYPERPRYPGGELFPGVVCGEVNEPANFGAWVENHRMTEPPFGRLWSWGTSVCAFWPVSNDEDRYTGPYTAETSTPLLITSTRFDPATPYAGAQVLRALAPDSVLVTVEGWGHTIFGLSTCGDALVTDYLVNQTLPAGDQVCPQTVDPFPLPERSSPGADARARLIAALNGATSLD